MSNKPSLGTNNQPKLSIVAQLDDMCRFSDNLIPNEEEILIKLIKKCEENRIKWLSTTRRLRVSEMKLKKSEEQNQRLTLDIKRLRYGFATELQKREVFRKQVIQLSKQLNAIKEFVMKEEVPNDKTRDKVLSYIHLDAIPEERDSDVSIEGLEYDVSEEDVLDKTFASHQSFGSNLNDSKVFPSVQSEQYNDIENKANDYQLIGNEIQSNGSQSSNTIRNRSHSDSSLQKVDNISRKAIKSDSECLQKNHSNCGQEVKNRQQIPCYTSSPLLQRTTLKRLKTSFLAEIPESLKNRFEERKHCFIEKRIIKAHNCGGCGTPIGFLSTSMVCQECRGICHTNCKDRLPVPCIPYRKPDQKKYQMSLIADFAPPTRPMVPALIIHCCIEIEKRGLKETGIYRKCGADKDVKALKDKLLKSKSGIPSLDSYDIHVLSNVVKRFLRDLDEPIVTRLLWRDFARAADQENPEEEQNLILKTVDQIPTSNIDTLAYIMRHLLKVSQNSEHNLMDTKGLAKIFGPTIVGYSMIDPPMSQLLAENPLQIKIIEALFRVPEESWDLILNTSYMSTIQSDQSIGSRQSFKQNRRSSAITGHLTPQRPSVKRSSTKGIMSLKPLF